MSDSSPQPVAGVPLHPLAMPNRCVLYTVSINQYDPPSSIGANVTCDTLFLHDANATRLSKWTAVRVTPTEGYSAKLKTSQLKLRHPPFLRNSGYAHTIYIDANVGVRQDPAELLELCNSSLCMFSVGRTIASEIQWLRSNQYASKNQTATLAQMYRSHLREQVWYGKVIVRRYGSPSLSCSEDEWLAAIRRPGAVQRDQVHINRALHACGQTIQDLRETGGNHRSVPRSAFSALLREPWAELASQKREGAEGDAAADSAPLLGAPFDAARRSLRRSGRARGGSPRSRPH